MKALKNATERRPLEKQSLTMGFGSEMNVKFVQHKVGGGQMNVLTTDEWEVLTTDENDRLTV